MTVGSLFAGVGGFDLGFERAGLGVSMAGGDKPVPPSRLATHWPKVERYEDITKCGSGNLTRVDCITAGVPCQDWSVAGQRAGIKGSRSGLFFEFARILRELRPTWFVFENVPGLFSSNGGRDFAEVQRVSWSSAGMGYHGVCLTASFSESPSAAVECTLSDILEDHVPERFFLKKRAATGILRRAKRRGRKLPPQLLAALGELAAVAPTTGQTSSPTRSRAIMGNKSILATGTGDHQTSSCKSPTPSEPKTALTDQATGGDGQTNLVVADTLTSCYAKHGGASAGKDSYPRNLVATLNSGGNAGGFRTEPGEHIVIQDVRGGTRDKTDQGQGIGIREGGPSYTLSKTERHGVAYALRKDPGGTGQGHNTNYVRSAPDPDGVRDFAGLPKGMDSPRYQALGDAVTVQVTEWIAKRIIKAHKTDA